MTEELAFEFHYFFTRKFWMLYHCQALVVAPGGFGTLDELFEVFISYKCEYVFVFVCCRRSVPGIDYVCGGGGTLRTVVALLKLLMYIHLHGCMHRKTFPAGSLLVRIRLRLGLG